nr:GRAM domain-containing protein 4-like isoform X3 [Penaeus vannamei]
MRALLKSCPKMDHMKGDGDQLSADAQLAALQEQLVAVMLDNQHLTEEVRNIRDFGMREAEQLRQQLEREKEKSRILMERLQEKETKEREKGEREARERERHPREKSLPPGDKSPSLPQRIRKRINQIHKSQSFEVEDGSPGPPPPPLPFSDKLPRVIGEERTNPKSGFEQPTIQIVKYGGEAANPKSSSTFDVVESTSRGRFAWKRRGLEKSKSLDQSEFLASLNGAASGGEAADPGWIDEDHRRESDSDEGERAILLREGIAAGRDSGLQTPVRCGGGAVVVTPLDPWWKRLEVRLLAGVSELIKDFSEVAEEELPDGDPEGDPLTVKKLKENILRFGCVMRPLTECLAVVTSLLHWESTSATLLALVVYLYSVLFGWVLTLILTLAIIRLSINYLKKRSILLSDPYCRRGWTQHMFRRLRREGGEAGDASGGESGLGDKFALVLQVARRVQNQLGAVSNAAEKCKNLLLWEHEATRRLYALLWVFLLASILLPSSQIFTLIGVYLGIKFFVLDYVFYRYPRIRQKYDSTSRLWDTLPTDADLERRNDKRHLENGCSSPDSTSFLELFNLPSAESPLPGWQTGRRCTLVNRDRSLTSAFKNGRLYLTNSYLCFERSKSQSAKNLKLSLKDVRVDKANSYPWIPGGGMAIDVTVENSGKGYFFAGILNRDEVFEGIIEGCRRFGATWCDTVPAQDSKASKDSKDNKDGKEPKDSKDAKEQKENKDK